MNKIDGMIPKAFAFSLSVSLLSAQSLFAQDMKKTDWQEEAPVATDSAPPEPVWNDATLKQNAMLLSLNEKIGLLELDVFGKTSPHNTPANRIIALENSVFGKVDSSNTNAIDRVSRLIATLQPSNELVSMVVIKATGSPGWSFKSSSAPWVSSASQLVSALEIELNGKSKSEFPLIERINNLEKLALAPGAVIDSSEVMKRINNLIASVPISERSIDKAKQSANDHAGWFWNPPQIHWLGSLGKGARNIGRGAENSAKSIATSPTFWTLLLGAGALTALYFMSRGGGESLPAYIVSERACNGNMNCTRCTNCRYCHYCNSGLNQLPCGVLLRIMQYGR